MKDTADSYWPTKPLGNLCRIELGSTPARKSAAMWDPDRKTENVWLSIADLPQTLHAIAEDSKEYVSDLAAERMRLIPKGTLLVSFKLTLGRLSYAGRDLFSNEAIASLLDIDEHQISKEFLYWALTAFDWDNAAEGDQKVKGKTLNKAKLKTVPIPLPPLEEQQRIVAVLDEAFEGLARASAHAEANLQNAQDLFDEAEAKLFRDISNGSTETTLGEIASFRNGLNYSRTSQGDEVKVVGVGDFQDNFTIPTDELSFTKIDGQLGENDRLLAGDILAVRSNGNRELIGRTMIMPESEEPTSFSGFTIRIRLNGEDVLPEYVCSFLRTKTARQKLTAGGGGANISNLNQRILSSFTISYPDQDGQREILDCLNRLRESSKSLRENYTAKLQDLNDLRQSLLQKAFAGELT